MGSKRNVYTKEFKIDAVKYLEKSNKSAASISRELGVDYQTLLKWKKEYGKEPEKAFPGKGNPRDEEIFRLKKELREKQEECDILKKAMAIFSKHQE